ncbi:conserved hypothetical protein [Burkholderia pseudomallei Pakistan 9]|uniref:Uncharacterized protein n=1 Tax=Burkholderia pseudomallei 1710a TaxID=320371 RepID=A0A0E1VU20_BURPE|nr:hypothetical protein BURPSS13_T0223 [Burkholderia pseudomallei S13]EDU10803.1 hypothetical protein BURPS1655_I0384 [Burkholderia pseudomallei 1655]EEH28796.1 conserved hypothetical protein [Burkholderia pseudomallei Pakistan 9]EEP51784.1 conserved hypothetical protein [Burkholderia pseudomallei MSHR346]EET04410.1 hypothetical protein BURPS1710A_A0238 [Burkholderia pseudomallei 1710a]
MITRREPHPPGRAPRSPHAGRHRAAASRSERRAPDAHDPRTAANRRTSIEYRNVLARSVR